MKLLSPLSIASFATLACTMLAAPAAFADPPVIGGGGPLDPGGPEVSHLVTVSKNCSSSGSRYAECALPGDVLMVELTRQDSRAACTLNRSFGFHDNVLWVDRGCRGEFNVTYAEAMPDPNVATVSLSCASGGYRYTECAAPGPVVAVELTRRDSSSACTLNRTFGFRNNVIWVDRGCRGQFNVTYATPPVIEHLP